MPRWLLAVFRAMNLVSFRLFGRRMRIQGRPLLLLTTIGAKTGRRRQTTLAYFPDEERTSESWLIVASAAGSAAHPSWYVNLARDPRAWIEVDGGERAVRAESLHAEERERAWRRVVALAPGYGPYAEKTDREIPIVRLVPREDDRPAPRAER